MDKKSDFIKVRAGLLFSRQTEITSDGFTDGFKNRLYDGEEYIRSQIIIPINEAIGIHNWATKFTQYPAEDVTFFCDIYVDNPNDYSTVKTIVEDKLPEIELRCRFNGTTTDYTGKQD